MTRSRSRARRALVLATLTAGVTAGAALPSPAAASTLQRVSVAPETPAAGARLEDRAKRVRYTKLRTVGVTASDALLDGKLLAVRLRARKTVELRLAIVDGHRITAFKKVTLTPGNYRLTGRLNLTPRGNHLRLRATARIGSQRGRGFLNLKFRAHPAPGPVPAPADRPPASLALSGGSVFENQAAGAVVGTLSGLDPDFGDTLSYALVAGPGDGDNADFTLVGGTLETTHPLDFEQAATRSIRVRVSDGRGGSLDQQFTITVTNVNDAPTAIALSNRSVAENRPAGTAVGTLSATDQDAGSAFTYQLVIGAGDADNSAFAVDGSTLRTTSSFDAETKASYHVRLRVSDGAGGTFEQAFTITVTDVDDAPILTGTPAALAYTENDPATVVDPGLTVSDVDSPALASASVRISAGLDAGDSLLFTDTAQITGVYDAASGRLTLTGSASPAAWQSALRSVRFASTSDDPAVAKSVAFTVNDGTLDSNAVTRAITVTRVNDVPAVLTSAGPVAYTEGDPATPVDPALTVTDPDSGLTGATVSISTGLAPAQDVLGFAGSGGITGNYDSASGVLTLQGDAPASAYEAVLRSVTYRNTSNVPSPAGRTISFVARDAGGSSPAATRAVAITATDTAPDVDNSAGALSYTENDPATAIDTAITITDPDSATLFGATVRITGNLQPDQDVLAMPSQPGITASYDSATGTLTLSGGASVAAYETALEAVTYRNPSDNPSTATRTVTYQVTDATGYGTADTHGIAIRAVDDLPVPVDDTFSGSEDQQITGYVLGNDTDPDGGRAGIPLVATGPSHASSFSLSSGGTFTYSPSPDYCGDDSFVYTLDGGSIATVTLKVACVDDPPVAVDDVVTVDEDSGADPIDVRANDTDIDGGPELISGVVQPQHGLVSNVGTSSLTYTPAANYCNDERGGTPDTFSYSVVPGNTSATVSVTVHCVDDAPVAVDDTATVSEDAPATIVDVVSNDTDVDGGPIYVAFVGPAAHGTTDLSAGLVEYKPDPDYCNSGGGAGSATPDTFDYALTPGGDIGTVSVTVTCVDDAPQTDLNGAAAGSDSTVSFLEGDAPVAIAPDATLSDIDDDNLESATVTLSGTQDPGETLAVTTAGTSITSSFYAPSGTLTLTGSDTKAAYEQVLRSVTYTDPAHPPQGGDRTATVVVNDGDLASPAQTSTITVRRANVPPAVDLDDTISGSDTSAAFTEDGPAVAIAPHAALSDADDANLTSATVTITNLQDGAAETLAADATGTAVVPSYAGGVLTLTGTDTVAHYQQVLRTITYADASDAPGITPRAITVTANDGKDDSNVATATVSVTPHNDAPTLDLDTAAAGTDTTAAFTEDAPPLTLAPRAAAADPDSPSLASATVTLTNRPDGSAESLSATTSGTAITAAAYDPNTGILRLDGPATPAEFQQVLRTVKYANTSQNPSPTQRTVAFSVSDGSAASPATATVTVTPVNDPPVVRLTGLVSDNATAAFTETSLPAYPGSGPVAIAPAGTIDDADNANLAGLTVTLTNRPQGTLETLSATAGGGVAVTAYDPATGKLVLTGSATPAAYQAALQSVKYNNLSDTPTTAARVITVTATDGTAASVSRTSTVSVTPTNDAPVATNKSYTLTPAIHNTAFIINTTTDAAPVVLDRASTATPATHQANKTVSISPSDPNALGSGNSDPDGPTPTVQAQQSSATTNGGRVDVESDGDIVYYPAPGCTATSDSFTYGVVDRSGTPPYQTSTATVSLALTGCVYYVDNQAPTTIAAIDNKGTSTRPFTTLAAALSAQPGNDTVYVFKGDGTTAGLDTSAVLANNQSLIGEADDLQIPGDAGVPLLLSPGVPANRPLLTNTGAGAVITMKSADTVRGVQLDPGTGNGIAIGAGAASGTIDDVRIIDTGAAANAYGISASSSTGTWDVSDLVIDNTGATGQAATSGGISLASAGTWNFKSAGTISIKVAGGKALATSASGGATMSFGTGSVFDDITHVSGAAGAVSVADTTGTVAFGDGVGTDLDLTTTGSSTPAFSLVNAGSVSIPAAGTANVVSSGGPAVSVSGTAGPALNFDKVTATNASGSGVTLSGLGNGTFTADSTSSITNATSATAADFDVNGGSGDVTYGGTITDATGRLVSVANTTGGTKSFSGAIADAASGPNGTGISLTNNTGATVRFDGGVALTAIGGNDGFTATGGGTVVVTDPAGAANNRINGSAGTALKVANTTIGTGGLTFQSISAIGGTNGIVLDNTGSTAGLIVTGSGGVCATTGDACTGGTIDSESGDGISLNATKGVVLADMQIVRNRGNGIRGAGVNGFSLSDSVVDTNGDDPSTNEAGLHLTDLSGTADVTRTVVANSPEDNARIVNSSGTLSQLNITDSVFRDTATASPGNDGLLLEADGGSMTADVKGSTFVRNRANGLQAITNGAGTMDLDVDDSGTAQSGFDDNNIGVNIAHNSSGTLHFNVKNLSIDGISTAPGTGGSASPINLNLGTAASGLMSGTVSGNALTNSDSTTGPGIRVTGNGSGDINHNGTMTVALTNNAISQVANRGIEVIARDGSNRINATIRNNTITLANALALDGIRVDAGAISTDTSSVCADIAGNTSTTAGSGFSGIRVRQRSTSTSFQLAGYGGGATDDTAVATFLGTPRNSATVLADQGGTGFASVANCPTPAP